MRQRLDVVCILHTFFFIIDLFHEQRQTLKPSPLGKSRNAITMRTTSTRECAASLIHIQPLLLVLFVMTITSVGAFSRLNVARSQYHRRTTLFQRNDRSHKNDAPTLSGTSHHLSIEFCTSCRWMMRSAWMAQELLTTFSHDLDSVTLVPSRAVPGGVFTVRHFSSDTDSVLWDRKTQGGFPESKQLKQRVRDAIVPDRDLGHSDVIGPAVSDRIPPDGCIDCQDTETMDAKQANTEGSDQTPFLAPQPNVAITYDLQWLLRASWLAQELLTTFPDHLNSVTLVPNQPREGDGGGGDDVDDGTFCVHWNDQVLLWDRRGAPQQREGFPEPKELSEMIREQLFGKTRPAVLEQEMDDEEAEQLRNFFGVM